MMIEPRNDEEWRDFGYIKCISVKKLKELLNTLPDDYMIYTKTLGHTGNLPIVKDGISPHPNYSEFPMSSTLLFRSFISRSL